MEWSTGLKKHGCYFSGFVKQLQPVLECHKIATTTTWGIRSSVNHGTCNRKRSAEERDTEVTTEHSYAKRGRGDGDSNADGDDIDNKENECTEVNYNN